jgi:hypothetical protein
MSGEQLQQLTAALKDRYRVIRELGRGGMATVYVLKASNTGERSLSKS